MKIRGVGRCQLIYVFYVIEPTNKMCLKNVLASFISLSFELYIFYKFIITFDNSRKCLRMCFSLF